MSKTVQVVDQRPPSTQQAWDRHLSKSRRRSIFWRVAKLLVVPAVVLVLLVIAAAPLAFG